MPYYLLFSFIYFLAALIITLSSWLKFKTGLAILLLYKKSKCHLLLKNVNINIPHNDKPLIDEALKNNINIQVE